MRKNVSVHACIAVVLQALAPGYATQQEQYGSAGHSRGMVRPPSLHALRQHCVIHGAVHAAFARLLDTLFVLSTSWPLCSSAAVAEKASELIAPHGGQLVDLRVSSSAIEDAVKSCNKQVECTDRQACDVECLTVGCVHACGRAGCGAYAMQGTC